MREDSNMVEVTMTWDLRPDIDVEACANFSKVAVPKVLQVPGCREFRAHRNMLGSPHVRATYVWQSLGECANFQQTDAWQALVPELNEYATHVEIQLCGPSPVMPESLRPGS